ncbi:MAG: guanylate kinase [Waddliaceae bacterium]
MQKLLGNLKKGLIFVISAPAGTGKTTLTHKLVDEFPCVIQNISCTTRIPRENETEGDHYHFLSREEFEKKIRLGEFLEYVKVYEDYYGTPIRWIEEQQNQGKHVVLVIDTQGAMQVKKRCQATSVFILPPSLEALRNRLIERGTESDEDIERRLAWAKHEMKVATIYDYLIINDNLDIAYQALRSLVIAEEHRKSAFQFLNDTTNGIAND